MSDEIMLRKLDHQYELYRQQLAVTDSLWSGALKVLILINGGALIGLFTLLGNLKADSNFVLNEDDVIWAMTMFVVGLVAACIAHFLAVQAQAYNASATGSECDATYLKLTNQEAEPLTSRATDRDVSKRLAFWTVVPCIVSLVAFCYGAAAGVRANEEGRKAAYQRAIENISSELSRQLKEMEGSSARDRTSPQPPAAREASPGGALPPNVTQRPSTSE